MRKRDTRRGIELIASFDRVFVKSSCPCSQVTGTAPYCVRMGVEVPGAPVPPADDRRILKKIVSISIVFPIAPPPLLVRKG